MRTWPWWDSSKSWWNTTIWAIPTNTSYSWKPLIWKFFRFRFHASIICRISRARKFANWRRYPVRAGRIKGRNHIVDYITLGINELLEIWFAVGTWDPLYWLRHSWSRSTWPYIQLSLNYRHSMGPYDICNRCILFDMISFYIFPYRRGSSFILHFLRVYICLCFDKMFRWPHVST